MISGVPRCYTRITFASFDARNKAFMSGIYTGSTRLFSVKADPVFKDIHLEHLPAEVPDDVVRQVLGRFGAVHEIDHLKFSGTSVCNGTRLIRMSLASDIPVSIRIMRYPCRVFYVGQPHLCSICRSPDHRAVDCPELRDVCRRCREPDHFARDCPVVVPALPFHVDEEEDDDDDDYVDGKDDDLSADDGDDDESCAGEDFASGDDEVLPLFLLLIQPARSSPKDSVPAYVPTPFPVPAVSPVPASVPMDTSEPFFTDRPQWIARAPEWVLVTLFNRTHSSDTHIGLKKYNFGDVRIALEFGRLTYRFIKETRFHEEDPFYAYLSGTVAHPRKCSFTVADVDLPSLPADVVPSCFPVSY